MMQANRPGRNKFTSLNAQIRDAERQLLNRRQTVGVGATTLIKDIHQQMTAPATLLLASGIGFIIGELTKCQTQKLPDTDKKKPAREETSPLRIALNLLTSIHTLYTALPLAWMIKSFCQPNEASCQTPQTPEIRAAKKTRNLQSQHSSPPPS